jgi:hypothetical protein
MVMRMDLQNKASRELSPLGAWLFALVFWVAGGCIVALAMDWIHAPPENFHAPRWVVGTAGLMFVAGGFAPLIANGGQDTFASRALALIVLGGFASISNWIAFGSGPRHFSGGTSVAGLSSSAPVSEISGRIAFGVGAVILDAMLVWILVKSARPKDDGQDP